MFTLFHFGFELLKIAIQAAIYSSIILMLVIILIKITGNDWLKSIKFRRVYFIMYSLLFVFSFTYYGNHGLGDEANLPLGHFKTMKSGDGNAYFYLGYDQIEVDSFLVHNDHLYFASEDMYYDYQLASGKWGKYNSKKDYEIYASANHLPAVNQFKKFYTQYDAYWHGWRFWFLP